MEYQKGDRVFIKPWLLMERQYKKDMTGDLMVSGSIWFTTGMEHALKGDGRVVVLGETKNRGFEAQFPDGSCWTVTPEMIAGYAFEYGEKIEVRESNDDPWEKAFFVAFRPGAKYPYCTVHHYYTGEFQQGEPYLGGYYRYVRRIEKPNIEITAKINGKEVPLSKISDETFRNLKEAE